MLHCKNFVLDLDGTLIDSALGIQFSFDFAYFQTYGLENKVDVRPLIGPPIGFILTNYFGETNESVVNTFVTLFKKHYDELGYQKTILFPNVVETLIELKHSKRNIFIATNKRFTPTKLILGFTNILPLFNEIYTIDSHQNSNTDKTVMLNNICKNNRLDITETIMIGDTEHDCIAAENNNIKFAWVDYGYGNCKKFDYLITDIKNILTIFNN